MSAPSPCEVVPSAVSGRVADGAGTAKRGGNRRSRTSDRRARAAAILLLILLGPAVGAWGAPPPAPTGLVARGDTGVIGLNWSDTAGAATYRVYQAGAAGGPFTPIANRDRSRHLVSGVPAGETRFFRVTAVNAASEESAPSSVVSAAADAASLDRAVTNGNYRIGSSFVTDSDRLQRFLSARGLSVATRRFQIIGAPIEYIWSDSLANSPTTFATEVTQLQSGSYGALVMNAQRPWEQGERELDGTLLFAEEALAARPDYRVFIHEYWIDDDSGSRTSLWATEFDLDNPHVRRRQQQWYWLSSVALAYEATRTLGVPVYVAPIGSAVEAAKTAALNGELAGYQTRADFQAGDQHLNNSGKYLQEGVVAAGAYQIDVRGTHNWVDSTRTLAAADAAKLQQIIHETVRNTPFSGWHIGAPTTLAAYLEAMRAALSVRESFDDFTVAPTGSTVATATNLRTGLTWNYTRATIDGQGSGRAEYPFTGLDRSLQLLPGGTLSTTLPDGLLNLSLRLAAPAGGVARLRVTVNGAVVETIEAAGTSLRGYEVRGIAKGGPVSLALENVGTMNVELEDLIWDPAGTADGGVAILTDEWSGFPQGVAVNRSLTAFGATNVTWSVVGGGLPAGVSLSANGTLSGTPPTLGSGSVTVRAADAQNATRFAERTFAWRVARPTTVNLTATAATLPLGQSAVLAANATGDDLRFAWFKDGTRLADAREATLAIPAAALGDAGSYAVRVSGAGGDVMSDPVSLAVESGGATTLATSLVTTGVTAGGNTFDLTNTGAKPVVLTGRFEGNFDAAGLTVTIYTRNGTAAGQAGSATGWTLLGASDRFTGRGFGQATPFWVKSGNQPATLTIPPGATVGFYLRASANVLRYSSGTTAVTLGALRFTPQAGLSNAAAFQASVTTGRVWNGRVEFYVDEAPAVTSGPPSSATLGVPFSHAFTAAPGNGLGAPMLSGSFPAGLSFDPATGRLTGTPREAGNFSANFSVSDFDGDAATQNFTLTVVDPFRQWLASKGLPAQTDPATDPAGEGIPLRLRHVLGLPVTAGAAARLPRADVADGLPQCTFTFDPTATGSLLTVQTSEDLRTWRDAARFRGDSTELLQATVVSRTTGAGGIETITLRFPATGGTRWFHRVVAAPAF